MAPSSAGSGRSSVGTGVLAGLMPLIRLAILFVIALALPTVARLALGSVDFATLDAVVIIASAVMLLVAAAVYAVSLVGVFRRMPAWRERGQGAQATAALWTLVATGVVVALPVMVAVLWPQHPAP